jgi:hypothetical protein
MGAFATGDVLQVLLVRVLFGCALSLVGERGAGGGHHRRLSPCCSRSWASSSSWRRWACSAPSPSRSGKYGIGSLKQLGMLVLLFYGAVRCSCSWCWGDDALPGFLGDQADALPARGTAIVVLATASSDSVLPQIMRKLKRMGVEGFGGGPGDSHRLLVQPRRVLHLPDAGRGVHRAGHQHAAVLGRPAGILAWRWSPRRAPTACRARPS